MYIKPEIIVGQKFNSIQLDSDTEWTCIGYGTPPDTGFPYIIGATWDQAKNRTRINSFKFKEIEFKGQFPV